MQKRTDEISRRIVKDTREFRAARAIQVLARKRAARYAVVYKRELADVEVC